MSHVLNVSHPSTKTGNAYAILRHCLCFAYLQTGFAYAHIISCQGVFEHGSNVLKWASGSVFKPTWLQRPQLVNYWNYVKLVLDSTRRAVGWRCFFIFRIRRSSRRQMRFIAGRHYPRVHVLLVHRGPAALQLGGLRTWPEVFWWAGFFK